jgi:hypothetical protein
VIPFRTLDFESNEKEASEKIRTAKSRIMKVLESGGREIPVKIENRRGEGYIMLPLTE